MMALREQPLRDALAEVRLAIEEFNDLLPNSNDARLRGHGDDVVRTARAVIASNDEAVGSDAADNLADLLSAVQALRIPANDPELGRTQSLKQLRSGKGLLVAALSDALKAAESIGLKAQTTPIPEELAVNIPRASVATLLDGIMRRLGRVEEGLRELIREDEAHPGMPQQRALVENYVGAMRRDIDLMRLHLSVDEKTVDVGALARLSASMTLLAGDVVATLTGWAGRVASRVTDIVKTSARKTAGIAAGVRAVVFKYSKRAHKSDPDTTAPSERAPPPEFDLHKVRDMILRGERPPDAWAPWITNLDLDNTPITDLAPLAGLTGLQNLYLDSTQVTDLAPLAGLTGLQILVLDSTQVTDLTPLAGLAGLHNLHLDSTRVTDLAPLAGLTGLQNLYLDSTQVTDLAPLAGLTGLQTLSLDSTQVTEFAPLARLTGLQDLHLNSTWVSDLTPLAGLTDLRYLRLKGTAVQDLGPVANVPFVLPPEGGDLLSQRERQAWRPKSK